LHLLQAELGKFADGPATPEIFFSAHGVPKSYVEEAGDPYKVALFTPEPHQTLCELLRGRQWAEPATYDLGEIAFNKPDPSSLSDPVLLHYAVNLQPYTSFRWRRRRWRSAWRQSWRSCGRAACRTAGRWRTRAASAPLSGSSPTPTSPFGAEAAPHCVPLTQPHAGPLCCGPCPASCDAWASCHGLRNDDKAPSRELHSLASLARSMRLPL